MQKEAWDALCNNRNPATGEQLTLRQKEHRRVGYDFNFHVPKSVSVLYSLTKDERILDAFRQSVNETMRDMESEMQTRVRKAGKNENRTTGNMLWGEFVHFTSRPVGGVPDPHLHAHCFVFNVTWDKKRRHGRPGSSLTSNGMHRISRRSSIHGMARRLAKLGIAIERSKTGWEIAGVPKSAIRQFSRRTALIEEEAKRKGMSMRRISRNWGRRPANTKRKI